jgi:hypothetical protein
VLQKKVHEEVERTKGANRLAGGVFAGRAFRVELAFLAGRKRLTGYEVFSPITY